MSQSPIQPSPGQASPDQPSDCRKPPSFDDGFRSDLLDLFRWRRDVRRFRSDDIDPAVMDDLLDQACLAPSVGNSRPWRFARVRDATRRDAVIADFEACNSEALSAYRGERAELYARLKLEGLREAPEQLAIFVDTETLEGHGLGRGTMPETLRDSVAIATHTLWLAARAAGVGVGWVSIINPDNVRLILDAPNSWKLVAYLCIGYPVEEHIDPELERHGWQDRSALCRQVLER